MGHNPRRETVAYQCGDHGGHEVTARCHRRRAEVEPQALEPRVAAAVAAYPGRNPELRAAQGRACTVVRDVVRRGTGATGATDGFRGRRGPDEREAAAAAPSQMHDLLSICTLDLHGQRFAAVHGLRGHRIR